MYCSYVISCIVLMFALFVSVMKCADGFFNVLFLEITNSRYQNKIMLSTLSQEDILAFKIDDDDIKQSVQNILAATPDVECHLFDINPCDYGFHLFSICKPI